MGRCYGPVQRPRPVCGLQLPKPDVGVQHNKFGFGGSAVGCDAGYSLQSISIHRYFLLQPFAKAVHEVLSFGVIAAGSPSRSQPPPTVGRGRSGARLRSSGRIARLAVDDAAVLRCRVGKRGQAVEHRPPQWRAVVADHLLS